MIVDKERRLEIEKQIAKIIITDVKLTPMKWVTSESALLCAKQIVDLFELEKQP